MKLVSSLKRSTLSFFALCFALCVGFLRFFFSKKKKRERSPTQKTPTGALRDLSKIQSSERKSLDAARLSYIKRRKAIRISKKKDLDSVESVESNQDLIDMLKNELDKDDDDEED